MGKPDNLTSIENIISLADELLKVFPSDVTAAILVSHSQNHIAEALYELGFNNATGVTTGALEGLTIMFKESLSDLTETIKNR